MVNRIGIGNFKSIDKLEFELGRFNVFIGENGCGKSNILEAIGMGAAASANKLENEFLSSRGIRVTDSLYMRSAFSSKNSGKDISISIQIRDIDVEWSISNDNQPYSSWQQEAVVKDGVDSSPETEEPSEVDSLLKSWKALETDTYNLLVEEKKTEDPTRKREIGKVLKRVEEFLPRLQETFQQIIAKTLHIPLGQFQIYSPENSSLRAFEREGQIEPLGLKGEGLFKLLKTFAHTNPEAIQRIAEELQVFDWFESFQLPDKTMSDERYIKVKDRFLDDALDQFDQRSTNEGFLFVLFYLALFISKDTPKFFAIDNIEASLNPKLCKELIAKLNRLSAENSKQVIMTTHSPAVLDGLDLTDDEQRLFVVYRNSEGRTRVRRVEPPKVMAGEEEVPLSEAFVRGYLGGLPKNF
ncbi:MAG: AAA family ATPase [Flavobacteriales bacterium]|nr:AAA family ATPase [Flavobacteriales bacterium]